jgi:hypothetical protein
MSGVNYSFGLTTTISPYRVASIGNVTELVVVALVEAARARSAAARARAIARPRLCVVALVNKNRGGGKVENLLWVFHFSIRPRRRSCGNVGISPAFGEISKGLVERGESLLLAFHAFHSPGISTALRWFIGRRRTLQERDRQYGMSDFAEEVCTRVRLPGRISGPPGAEH